MFDVFQKMLGSGSLEARYLQMILFVDQAESLANDLLSDGLMRPDVVLALAQVKQAVLDEFAQSNRAHTLISIENEVEQARSKGGE